MTEPTRQLPGVKGQWILCSECPPTEADGDSSGDVIAAHPHISDWEFVHWADLAADRYWLPAFDDFLGDDPRPFTLPAAPAPEQPATTERRIVQLSRHGDLVYVVADDGTAWVRYAGDDDWEKLAALPPRDA